MAESESLVGQFVDRRLGLLVAAKKVDPIFKQGDRIFLSFCIFKTGSSSGSDPTQMPVTFNDKCVHFKSWRLTGIKFKDQIESV